jgi:ABC-type Fe3+-hydroxamate transport system substrate-binding protein
MADDIRVTSSGPAGLGTHTLSGGLLVIPFSTLIKNQTVAASYVLAGTSAATDVGTDGVTDFAVTTRIGTSGTARAATKITGGVVATVAGSGDVTLSPVAAAVSTPRTFTVIYTALTDLGDNAILEITPDGIVDTDDSTTPNVKETLSRVTNAPYGYVRPGSVMTVEESYQLLAVV